MEFLIALAVVSVLSIFLLMVALMLFSDCERVGPQKDGAKSQARAPLLSRTSGNRLRNMSLETINHDDDTTSISDDIELDEQDFDDNLFDEILDPRDPNGMERDTNNPVGGLPAPLIRRDSTQTDDHDMTCLHFFALGNRSSEDIDTVMAQLDQQETQNNTPTKPSSSSPTQANSVSSTSVAPFRLNINSSIRFLHLTPLHFAAINSDPPLINTLLKHGALINKRDALGRTPLRHAVNLSRLEVIATLLEAGALDLPDRDGTTSLKIAVFHNDIDVVKVYLNHRPEACCSPIGGNLTDDYGLDQEDQINTSVDSSSGIHPMHAAASFGLCDMVKLLVSMGGEVDGRDAQRRTPVMYAATEGKLNVVELLLTANQIKLDESLIRREADTLIDESVSLGLRNRHDKNINYGAMVSLTGYAKKVADPNAFDIHGWTALHYASVSTKGTPSGVINMLISFGANINAAEHRFHLTPLHMAAKSGLVATVKLLLQHGADIRSKTCDDRTALCFAAYSGHVECTRLLIQKELELEQKLITYNKNDRLSMISWLSSWRRRSPIHGRVNTPFQLAVRGKSSKHSIEIINMFIEAGADVDAGLRVDVEKGSPFWKTAGSLGFTNASNGKPTFGRSGVDELDNWTTIKVSPTCFALASGHLDVALALLKAPGWRYMGIIESIMCAMVAISSGRYDLMIRVAWKTPALLIVIFFILFFVGLKFLVSNVPPVNNELMTMVKEACKQRKSCSLGCHYVFTHQKCCLLPAQGGEYLSFKELATSGTCWMGTWGKWERV